MQGQVQHGWVEQVAAYREGAGLLSLILWLIFLSVGGTHLFHRENIVYESEAE